MAACTVRIKIEWWLRWYLAGVALCAFITGAHPDMDKVKDKVMKGVKQEHSDEYRRAYWSGLLGLVVVGAYLMACMVLLAVALLNP